MIRLLSNPFFIIETRLVVCVCSYIPCNGTGLVVCVCVVTYHVMVDSPNNNVYSILCLGEDILNYDSTTGYIHHNISPPSSPSDMSSLKSIFELLEGSMVQYQPLFDPSTLEVVREYTVTCCVI